MAAFDDRISEMNTVLEKSFDLLESLAEANENDKKLSILQRFVSSFEKTKFPVIPDFDKDLKWFNVKKNLSFVKELKGKVVLLDFFTYCCINCMHILPGLHALEEKHPESSGLVVLGVHSAKFDNEKDSGNILNAILRYGITHGVVNDPDMGLWKTLMVQCWPTLVLVSPSGEILLSLMGEDHLELLDSLMPLVLQYYKDKGQLSNHSIGIELEIDKLPPSPLLYPGKISMDEEGRRLAVSDTAHHRILVTDTTGHVQYTIGGLEPGYKDGDFAQALFNSPQGLAWKRNAIYVADTENHRIRQIELDRREVKTIAGTGVQGQDKEGGNTGLDQPISSPWDVVLVKSVGASEEDTLVIAMAGLHQIWVLFLQDSTWIKGVQHKAGTCIRFAGSGNEENRNNSYPQKASFAQPSGLAVGRLQADKEDLYLYIADSESSSVRYVSLTDGAVKGLVGGSRDPTNLFAYGDVDGKAFDAKLQHPLAVAVRNRHTGPLLVADSYNHKIKEVDLETKECRTLYGGDKTDNGQRLDEPGGLCVDPTGSWLYIADTNNHSIKVLDLDSKHMSQLVIHFPRDNIHLTDGPVTPKKSRSHPNSATVLRQPKLLLASSGNVCVQLAISLADSLHPTDNADAKWRIYSQTDDDISSYFSGDIALEGTMRDLASQPSWLLHPSQTNNHRNTEITVEVTVYYCDDAGACRMKVLAFVIPLELAKNNHGKQEKLRLLSYEISVK